jgi:hypothetical protein
MIPLFTIEKAAIAQKTTPISDLFSAMLMCYHGQILLHALSSAREHAG